MRQECELCGEHQNCNDDGVCYGCLQDQYDLENWVPEDGFDEEDLEDSEVK